MRISSSNPSETPHTRGRDWKVHNLRICPHLLINRYPFMAPSRSMELTTFSPAPSLSICAAKCYGRLSVSRCPLWSQPVIVALAISPNIHYCNTLCDPPTSAARPTQLPIATAAHPWRLSRHQHDNPLPTCSTSFTPPL